MGEELRETKNKIRKGIHLAELEGCTTAFCICAVGYADEG